MKFSTLLLAGAMLMPATAFAQTAPAAPAPAAAATAGAKVAAGATIYDTAGGVVGTVDSVTPQGVVISTGTVKAAVPVASIGTGAKGPTMAMTKAQLEAAAGQQQATAAADFKSKLVAGAPVSGTGGANIGTIKAADAQFVTVTTAKGDVKLPVAGFGPSPSGGVLLGMTAAQLDAAMGKAGATTPGTAAATGATAAGSTTTTTTTAPAAGATTDATAATAPAADAAAGTTAGATTDATAGTATTTETTTTKKTTKKKR